MTSKGTDQSVHLPRMVKVLFFTLDSPEAVDSDQTVWMHRQAALSLPWLHKFYCRFCLVLAHLKHLR